MYILVIILPFFGFLLAGAFGRYFGRHGSAFLSTFCLFLVWLLSFFIFYEVCLCQCVVSIKLYNWVLLDIYKIDIGLFFDTISSCMVVIVSTISFLVHLYSISYMSHDPYLSRFMCYLSLFTFFMLLLVTSDNFLQMFVGWEGVGLCSYLLINFWFTRILANKAALKAMIMNRIADVFFIIAILIILITFKTTDYIVVFNLVPFILTETVILFGIPFYKVTIIAFFLFIGAIGKSAQIGFHTWLPDAMEGPTPVSALLHAATMVTAGVFLVVRCSIFFEYSEHILILLTLFGGFTAIFAGAIAVFQYDIKKIIAYSTCSQLGYMFFSCGLSNYYVAFFHLFNHAFFKALLFLSAGSLIHSLFDEQDMRRMGANLKHIVPFTYICFIIGSFAIMGFPFLTGFYSKDLILEFTYSRYIIDSNFIYFLGIISAMFTVIYSTRLIYFVFEINNHFNIYSIFYINISKRSEECTLFMFISMFILCFCSIFIGYIFSDLMLGWGTWFWGDSIYVLPEHMYFVDGEFIHPLIKNLPVLCSFFVMFLTNIFLNNIDHLKRYRNNICYLFFYKGFYLISTFFNQAGFVNVIYNKIFLDIFSISYWSINKYLDKGLFEFFGPYGSYKLFYHLFRFFEYSWLPVIFFSIFFMFLGASLILLCWLIIFSWVYGLVINYLGLIPIIIILLYNNIIIKN